MSRRSPALALALLATLAMPAAAAPMSGSGSSPSAAMDKPSLYKRLGGYDALAAVTDDFLGRIAKDPKLSRFLSGISTDSLGRIRQHIVENLCASTGGPCVYTGRTMKASHAGLGITREDFQQSAVLLTQTLDKFNVPAAEKAEVLAFVGTLEKDIVDPPKPAMEATAGR